MYNKKAEVDVIQAAGGLIWRNISGEKKLAVIHRPKYNDWTLPKGKLNPGENWKEAALREVWEETGCKVEIDNFAGCIRYAPKNVPKIVLFWHMKLSGDCCFQPNNEVDQLLWLTVEDALVKLQYQDEKELIAKFS